MTEKKEKQIFRQCNRLDLASLLRIRKEFDIGNGGGLKYSQPENINPKEYYGIFLDNTMISVVRFTECNFFYYQLVEGQLHLDNIPNCVYRSTTFMLPKYRSKFGWMFLRLIYSLSEKLRKPIVNELRGVYQGKYSLFWLSTLQPYLGLLSYYEYLSHIERFGEKSIVDLLPKTLVSPLSGIGNFHPQSKVIQMMNKRNGFQQIGYSYSTASPVYIKKVS